MEINKRWYWKMENQISTLNSLSVQAQIHLKKRWPGEKDINTLLLYIEKELKSICWTPFTDNENIDFLLVAPKKAKSSKFLGSIFVLFGILCLFIVPSPLMGIVYLLFFSGMGTLMYKRGNSVSYLLEAYTKFKA